MPGALKLFNKRDVSQTTFSTHNAPLSVLMDYLEQAAKAEVWLIGICPKHVQFGEPMSPELDNAAKKLAEIIINFSESMQTNDYGNS